MTRRAVGNMSGPGRADPVHFKQVPLAAPSMEKYGGHQGRQEADGTIQMED